MAKLNGVKTLDMVNGEITKVEYDGAVYAKVEGDATKGDIVLIVKEWCLTINNGEFYSVEKIEYDMGRGFVYVKQIANGYQSDVQAFRKVEDKWSKIGRKFNEFKSGDIVRVTDTTFGHRVGTIGELVPAPEFSGTEVGVFANGIKKSHIGQIELITPVEARFDR